MFAEFLLKAKQNQIRTVGNAFVATGGVEGLQLMTSLFWEQVYEPTNVPFQVFKKKLEADIR
jgi:hypothetical protein